MEVATPAVIPSPRTPGALDAIFFASNGFVTSISASAGVNWQVDSGAREIRQFIHIDNRTESIYSIISDDLWCY